MNATPRQVGFWTGAVGLATLAALRRRGERVRLVNRPGTAPVPHDVEVLGGDASDPAFAVAAARGAEVVYQTLNPAYHRWVELFPGLQAGVLAAAQASGARLVSMENSGSPCPRSPAPGSRCCRHPCPTDPRSTARPETPAGRRALLGKGEAARGPAGGVLRSVEQGEHKSEFAGNRRLVRALVRSHPYRLGQ